LRREITNDQPKRHRRSVRLQDYDYSQSGAYFVTICTQERTCMFGKIVDGAMQLNDAGIIVDQCWLNIPNHFPQVDLDAFIVMPNHVHGIIVIAEGGR
jgi:REP element-mobilizing transposase RayT